MISVELSVTTGFLKTEELLKATVVKLPATMVRRESAGSYRRTANIYNASKN